MPATKISYQSAWGIFSPIKKGVHLDTVRQTRAEAIEEAVGKQSVKMKESQSQRWKYLYGQGYRTVRLNVNYVS